MSCQSEIIKNLCEWLEKKNFVIENVNLFESDDLSEGRCILSAKNFNENDIILQIPLNLMINYTNSIDNLDLRHFYEWCSDSNTFTYRLTRLDALYLYLIYEYSDSNSHLSHFIASLPKVYDTPENFDLNLISALPLRLRQIIEVRLDKLKFRFENIKTLLNGFTKSVEISETFKKLVENFSFSLFNWIYCSVNTRCFHLDELDFIDDNNKINLLNRLFGNLNRSIDKTQFKSEGQEVDNELCCLIPYLDFMNHSFNLSNVNCYFDKTSKSYLLQAKNDISIGSQIYGTYGYYDNKTLLTEYGFILEENPYDNVSFDKCGIMKLEKLDDNLGFEKFWQEIIKHKLNSDLTCNLDSGPSWSLLKLIDYLICFERNNECQFIDYDFISEPNDIKLEFQKLLENYKTEVDDSLNKLKKIDLNSNKYHLAVSIKFCELQLDIIKKNFVISNDQDSWILLF